MIVETSCLELFDSGPPIPSRRGHRGPTPRDARRRALWVAAIGWLPVLVLSEVQVALGWGAGPGDVAADIAVHLRSLVAAPLLLIAEPFCASRLGEIAQHFVNAGLVPEAERARFDSVVASTRRLRDPLLAQIVVWMLAYAVTFGILYAEPTGASWRHAAGGPIPMYSLPGWWQAAVSLPILLAVVIGWLWRLVLWTRFLLLVSRLRLELVAAHPDLTAGLKFVGYSVRAFAPVALGWGCVVAGTVANEVITRGQPLVDQRYTVLAHVLSMGVLFGSPPLVFMPSLIGAWRSGVFRYGGIGLALGRQFERKWLDKGGVEASALEVQDFSATVDLYQFVANVYDVKIVPWDLKSLVVLAVAATLPFVPLVFFAVPFDVVLKSLADLLL